MVSSDSTSTTVDQSRVTTISDVHPDILQTHVFTRLDGPTLASAGCASTQLHALSTESNLWRDICNHTWPSTTDTRVDELISTFPSGYRSFFSDSFPALGDRSGPSRTNPHRESPTPSELICAVDIRYREKLILTKVQEVETVTGWFLCSPFRIDLLEHKEMVPTRVRREVGEDTCRLDLEEHFTLSWILIDPARKRAANFSSPRPVSVQRHWLTGEIQVRYVTILDGGRVGSSSESVQCTVQVTCGGKEGGDLHVREVSLVVEDMDGKNLSGKDCLVILQQAMEGGRKKQGKRGDEKEKYGKYLELKRERRERKERREKRIDMVCVITGVVIFVSFWTFVLIRPQIYI